MIDQESSRRSAELVSPLQRNSAKTVTFWMPIANIAQQKLALIIIFNITDNRNEAGDGEQMPHPTQPKLQIQIGLRGHLNAAKRNSAPNA